MKTALIIIGSVVAVIGIILFVSYRIFCKQAKMVIDVLDETHEGM